MADADMAELTLMVNAGIAKFTLMADTNRTIRHAQELIEVGVAATVDAENGHKVPELGIKLSMLRSYGLMSGE